MPERILQKTRVSSIPTFCESYYYVFRSEVINFCLVLAWFDENNENCFYKSILMNLLAELIYLNVNLKSKKALISFKIAQIY